MLNINTMLNTKLLSKMAVCVVRAVGETGATEDIVQDAVVRILANADTFDPDKGAFDSWACRIASNVARNWRRSHANHGHDSEEVHDDERTPLVDMLVGTDGVAEVMRRDDERAVERALASLDETERKFLDMVREGATLREAGIAVGWSPATATRRYRALVDRLGGRDSDDEE